MSVNITKLATAGHVDSNLATDQILAAAASKLLDQQREIDKLNGIIAPVQTQRREDGSVKQMIRDLFMRVDPRIITAVDAGLRRFVVQMQPEDLAALEKLASDPEGTALIKIMGARPINQTVAAGQLQRVSVEAEPGLRQ
jgi:hypothetical protein